MAQLPDEVSICANFEGIIAIEIDNYLENKEITFIGETFIPVMFFDSDSSFSVALPFKALIFDFLYAIRGSVNRGYLTKM